MQAAQVIETVLSRYGTITPDLPAAPASVVAFCGADCQLLEACPDGCLCDFSNRLFTLPAHVLTHGRAQLLLHL